MKQITRIIIICFTLMYASSLEAHNSVCHMWHSCPSHSESYICGGLGRCSECPDNQYCKAGKSILSKGSDPKTKQKPIRDLNEVFIKPSSNKPVRIRVKPTQNNSGNPKSESYYKTSICKKLNGVYRYALKDRGRVDCLTDKYAVGIDSSNKWADLVGQALYYSMNTGKKAGIVLIMNRKNSQKHLESLKNVLEHYRLAIKVWTLKTN